jgi:hypothetical protein
MFIICVCMFIIYNSMTHVCVRARASARAAHACEDVFVCAL